MSHPLRKTVVSLIGSTLLVTALGLAPAAAEAESREPSWNAPPPQAQSDHDGDADSDSGTSYTEDNDTNDGGTPNNVPDERNDHPSGNDRSVENGKSGNQGRAESDPDDDDRGPQDRGTGGPDKPNGAGGVDMADQDGNNGCGNDDDFEDDNNGWCGRKPAEAPPAAAVASTETEQQPCPNGSMTRPCSSTPKTNALAAAATESETEQPCPDGTMTRPCSDATPVAAVTVEVGCSTADRCAERSAVVRTPVRGGIAEDDAVVAAPGLVQSAGTMTPVSTVSARSGGAAVLASIPVLGDIIEGELPMTGGNILTLVALAGVLLAIGTLFVRGSRRKAGTAS